MLKTVLLALCKRKSKAQLGNKKEVAYLDTENQQPKEVSSAIKVKGGKDKMLKTSRQMQDIKSRTKSDKVCLA